MTNVDYSLNLHPANAHKEVFLKPFLQTKCLLSNIAEDREPSPALTPLLLNHLQDLVYSFFLLAEFMYVCVLVMFYNSHLALIC